MKLFAISLHICYGELILKIG